MKIIHRITKQEAIEAYRQLKQISEETIVEVENESSVFFNGDGTLQFGEIKPVPMPAYVPPSCSPGTYC